MRVLPWVGSAVASILVGLGMPGAARADLDLKFSGQISSDIRYRLGGEAVPVLYPSQGQLLPNGFSRNDNLIKTKLTLTLHPKVKAVAEADLVLYGFSDAKDIDALTLHERLDPYRLEVHAAYLDLYKLLPGLDLRVGRQVVVWGAADQFNPTSNVNTLDFSDALLFGRALANNMIRADYNPKGDWILSAVWVPIFRPAELPRSAPIALRMLDRSAPVQEEGARLFLLQEAYNNATAPRQVNVSTYQPEVNLANSQVALRLAGRILGQDVSLSYYHGRFGLPVPVATINHDPPGNPSANVADVAVIWPKMDVLGADIAGTIEKLAGMGYWIEGAVIFPQEVRWSLYNDNYDDHGNVQTRTELRFDPDSGGPIFGAAVDKNGAYVRPPSHVPDGYRPTVIPSTPFFKLTVGADFSIGSHVYVNLQYLHGFIDEFGAGKGSHPALHPQNMCIGLQGGAAMNPGCENPRIDQRIGDYFVGGIDVKLLSDTLLLRAFGVIKIPSLDLDRAGHFEDYRPTGVLFPQLAWTVWDGTELSVGAFVYLGDRTTKFGDPAAGASELFARAKFTY